jgi:organic radical activating enzyme
MSTPKVHYTQSELAVIRATPGRTALLFITDRCPVECAHCSVGSRTHSPGIANQDHFETMVQALAQQPGLEVVGISGGEPFVERQGLAYAVEQLQRAGLGVVIFSSGLWGRSQETPDWIQTVLSHTNTLVLSTDAFHQNKVSPEHFCRAARAVVKHKVWLVVQTLNPSQAHVLLQEALGPFYQEQAEIIPLRPLSNGRGSTVFVQTQMYKAQDLSPCPLVANPVLRHDGILTACCNEDVITGHGPSHLRTRLPQHHSPAQARTQLREAIVQFQCHPLLRLMRTVGPAALLDHPEFTHLQNKHYRDTCEFCWAAHEALATLETEPCP